MKNLFRILLLTTIVSGILFAAEKSNSQKISPVGTWTTIDDKTHKPKSVVVIEMDENGKLRGKITKLILRPDEDQDPVCDKCKDSVHKDKKILGMEILWDFHKKEANDTTKWVDGKILDPNDGNIYSCNLTVKPDGSALEVRGYIGFSFIGRSQTWVKTVE